jgi:hypothetical protein
MIFYICNLSELDIDRDKSKNDDWYMVSQSFSMDAGTVQEKTDRNSLFDWSDSMLPVIILFSIDICIFFFVGMTNSLKILFSARCLL